MRASSKIFDSAAIMNKRWAPDDTIKKVQVNNQESNMKKTSWKEKIIIDPEDKIKAFFDVFMLFNVGYSCFTNVYYVAFS